MASLVTFGIFGLTGLLVCYCLLFIVPPTTEMFNQMQIILPLPTRFYLALSSVFRSYWFVLLPVAALLSVVPLVVARRRAWIAYVIATLMALLFAFGGAISIIRPIVMLQDVIEKKS